MQVRLAEFIRGTPPGQEAEAILRACVHCGFCTAVCPTYQLLGDELDGPRGRIYLVKRVLEGAQASARTRLHLDRCLTCRACEPACPSGVRYGRLADIGRAIVEAQAPRPLAQRLLRRVLAAILPRNRLFGPLLRLARRLRPLLPAYVRRVVPRGIRARGAWPAAKHRRRMIALAGCVQPGLAPSINAAAARVLDGLGISLLEQAAGCCGALRYHLNRQAEGLTDMKAMIDAWWPRIESGEVEAIVMTASGCGVTVKQYGELLAGDPAYAHKARRVSEATLDLAEVLARELPPGAGTGEGARRGSVAFQAPCTLQHGQRIVGVVEELLQRFGFDVVPVPEGHLCCGSAGTYSILQPALARELRSRKLKNLLQGAPEFIATANIGCMAHLQEASAVPVLHWIELLERAGGR